MLTRLDNISRLIGHTALHRLNFPGQLYAKLEFQNLYGSIKDRPALYIIRKALEKGIINEETIVIESTSGNFGIALAGICRTIGVRFISVIDPNISRQKEQLLRLIAHRVIKVTERDDTGGYLLMRIRTVQEFLMKVQNSYNPNQYENPDNYLSYYHTLGNEICNSFDRLDYLFVSVSSCGTIIGLSKKVKEKFPGVQVVAVDIEGSMIFSYVPKSRRISGLGASMRSPLLDKATIDKVVILSEGEIIEGCYELLDKHTLFVGASAGAAFMAAKKVLKKHGGPETVSVFISPDHGSAYLDNIYSPEWMKENVLLKAETNEIFE